EPPADLTLPVDLSQHKKLPIGHKRNREYSFYRTVLNIATKTHREDTAMQTRRLFLGSLACAATLANTAVRAQAQLYPSRAIKMIVPFPPGGPADAIGRVVAEGMRASLGQPVIVENVGGASGSLGAGQVARAAPDGYTVGVGNSVTH